MNLRKCILTRNDCYTSGRTITPRGVMVHSTGANNPTLRRYVQPDDGLLGDNRYDNDWNRTGTGACVHAFIGELADGSVATYQTLPWNWRGWHAASGPNGSANNTHISFEICEDGLDDPVYFAKVYKEAAELTAYLCKLYDLDPEADGVVICHSEGHTRGIASNHGDVMHWFPRHGKNMDDFRAEVARLIKNQSGKDELDMTKEELVSCAGTGDNPSGWAREHTEYCKQKGIFAGDGAGNYGWQQPITREAVATIVHRALEVAGLADSIPDA